MTIDGRELNAVNTARKANLRDMKLCTVGPVYYNYRDILGPTISALIIKVS